METNQLRQLLYLKGIREKRGCGNGKPGAIAFTHEEQPGINVKAFLPIRATS